MSGVDYKTIHILDSMTKYKTFSHYDRILAKTFKDKSLKGLVYSLQHQKIFIRPKFLEEFNKKYPIDNQDLTKIELEKKSRNFSEYLNKKKKKKKIIIDDWSKGNYGIHFCEPGPDPMRYTPNYKSVFKTIPSHKFSPLRIKNKPNQNIELDKIPKTVQNTIYNPFNKTITQKSNNIPTNTLPSVSTISLINTRNNHAYKFGDYIPRKNQTIQYNNILSYIEPHNYKTEIKKRKIMDFKKMVERSKANLINVASLEVPPSGYYNPKYDYIDKKGAQTLFTHKFIIDKNKRSNKFLIHKLWTSYNVSKQYKLIDNDKLKKDISLDII
jgi:hypothetical protein